MSSRNCPHIPNIVCLGYNSLQRSVSKDCLTIFELVWPAHHRAVEAKNPAASPDVQQNEDQAHPPKMFGNDQQKGIASGTSESATMIPSKAILAS